MSKWVEVCGSDELSAEGKLCLAADSRSIVLCEVAGEVCAVENVCPHAGLPLGEGDLRGAVLTCPYHGYAYDVRSGVNVDFPKEESPVRSFQVQVRRGRIWVEVEP